MGLPVQHGEGLYLVWGSQPSMRVLAQHLAGGGVPVQYGGPMPMWGGPILVEGFPSWQGGVPSPAGEFAAQCGGS